MSGVLAVFALVLTALVALWLPHPLPARTRAGFGEGLQDAAPPDRAAGLVRSLGRRLRRQEASAEAGEWVDWIRQLAALIRAGQSPAAAFGISAQTASQAPVPRRAVMRQERLCRAVTAAAALGRSPSESLRAEVAAAGRARGRAERTQASVLMDLARCWEVSERTGAPLAALLEGAAEAAEGALDADAARETALAGAKATVRILSWLPVLALGLGVLIGADPVRTLLTTRWGIVAGVLGAVLTVIGRVWTRRMVHQAEAAAGHRAGPERTSSITLEASRPVSRPAVRSMARGRSA